MGRALIASAAAALAVVGVGGLSLIKEHEGIRTSAYLDPVGIPTICYGHTGPEVRMGLKYTMAQCETMLLQDIAKHRAGLSKCVKQDLNSNQWDALTSFAFNVGVTRACNSTLVKKVNAGDLQGAAAEFPKWKYAGGRVLPGLVRRRAAEQTLFEQPMNCGPSDVKVTYSHLRP